MLYEFQQQVPQGLGLLPENPHHLPQPQDPLIRGTPLLPHGGLQPPSPPHLQVDCLLHHIQLPKAVIESDSGCLFPLALSACS